ncbi:MAG: enoyl-CoA hydratase/isomerase family protein [Usitatibacter sp.]
MSGGSFEAIQFTRDKAVAVLTLNRPDQLNAMSAAMRREIAQVLAEVEGDSEVRALVVTGSGRAFSTGFDLKEQMNSGISGTAEWRRVLWDEFATTMSVWRSRVPTIAAVHGPCLAGGMELAISCDITIAADDATFGEPELKFGAGIVTMILPWVVGPKRAKEIILLGLDRISAAEALQMGFVNRVVPGGEHLAEAMRAAHRIAAIDPNLVSQTKQAINRTFDIMGLAEALQASLDIDLHIESEGSPDKRRFFEIARSEGLRAAFAWRDARFP